MNINREQLGWRSAARYGSRRNGDEAREIDVELPFSCIEVHDQ